MRTAANAELELLTNIHLSPPQVLELQDQRLELGEQEEAAEAGRAAYRASDGSDPAETIERMEIQLDEMEAERDGALGAYQALLDRVVDALYEHVDNEGLREQLLDIAYGTVE
jgi:hypothetical protein